MRKTQTKPRWVLYWRRREYRRAFMKLHSMEQLLAPKTKAPLNIEFEGEMTIDQWKFAREAHDSGKSYSWKLCNVPLRRQLPYSFLFKAYVMSWEITSNDSDERIVTLGLRVTSKITARL